MSGELPLWRVYAINDRTGERDVCYVRARFKRNAKDNRLRRLGFAPWRITQARLILDEDFEA